ncbi:dipeptide epimerase [Synechococcus sp. RSCCF101]|uniref:dipeptide epimerase n=1 Tax=Synechococcus sp. RSCCF101 TaxID=2511069 RepID=UPI001245D9AA|nr:dipeptide epimerase [Synechococcus sp. RSCCF101]QEY30893.1 dipeptide epimerase [Synechococcus sp. RSCCF101]QEY33247.1 dipeptide epimerase [Synechococcus sp. RSCCF101]
MLIRIRPFRLTKAVPLAISRGTTSAVTHLEVRLDHEGLVGIGETGGFETGHRGYETDAVAAELKALPPDLGGLDPRMPQAFESLLAGLSPPARCGLDLALLDWWARWLNRPLWQLWGLQSETGQLATSVTLGLGTVGAVLSRLERWWTQLPASRIKLKLGSSDGPGHDRLLLHAVAGALERRREEHGQPLELQVDANGGWTVESTLRLMPDLVRCGVSLLEQPLPPDPDPRHDSAGFAALHPQCPMPLVADESCWDLEDLLRLAPHVDGINIKLLKSGGLSEGLLMARTARRLGLSVMLGCYSDGGLLNGAAAQLLPLARWPDLDSHLNLLDDPFRGLPLQGDRLSPPHGIGLGITMDSRTRDEPADARS